MPVDVRFENHGSVALARPVSSKGKNWMHANVEAEGWQWFGGALAVEPRHVDNLAVGMAEAGLKVGGL